MTRTRPIVLFACAFVAATTAHAAKNVRVGVLPTPPLADVAPDDTAALDDELKSAVATLGGYDVVDAKAMGEQLVAARDIGLDCGGGDVDCLAKVGVLAGLDQLVGASLRAAPGGQLDADVFLIDVKGSKELGRKDLAPFPRAALREQVRAALVALARPPADGALRVEVNVPGARVFVDDVEGPAQRSGLAPGVHVVAALADGYGRVETRATVRAGESTLVKLALSPVDPAGSTDPPPAVDPTPPGAAPTASFGVLHAGVVAGSALLGLGAVVAGIAGGAWFHDHGVYKDRLAPTEERTAAWLRLGGTNDDLNGDRIRNDSVVNVYQYAIAVGVGLAVVGAGVGATAFALSE